MKTNTKASVPFFSLFVLLFVGVLAVPQCVRAANQTWSATPASAAWQISANWAGGAAPGDISNNVANTVNGDIATFNTPLSGGIGGAANPIVPDDATTPGRSRRVAGITFDTINCGPYVIFSPSTPVVQDGTSVGTGILYVCHTNFIQITGQVTNSQVVLIPLQVDLPASTPGVFTFLNNSTNPGVTLTINSATHHGATTRGTTYVLDGTNTADNVVTNLSEGPSAGGAGNAGGILKQGPGNWIVAGPGTFVGNSQININQGTLKVRDPGAFGVANGVTNNAVLEIDGVDLTSQNITLRTNGTLRANGTITVNGITVATIAANNSTLATTSPSDVMTIGNTLNKFTGGAKDSVLHITGPGTVLFSQTANYAGGISVDTGTNQVSIQGALGLAVNLNINAGAVFDSTPVGVSSTYILDARGLSANGTGMVVGSTASTVSCDPTSTIDFASRPLTLAFAPTSFTGDTGHPALYSSSGTMAFHGNQITVSNASGTPLGIGTYQLVHQATGNISSSGAFVALITGSGLGAGLIGEIVASGGDLNLIVSAYTPKSLVWIGNDPLLPTNWDRQVSTNWLNSATPSVFNIYDSVTFNSTGSAAPGVFITNVMQPSSVIVDTSANNYTFTGPGQIAGGTSLIKLNTGGTLVLQTANTYSGGTIISNGTIKLAIDEGVSSTGQTGTNDMLLLNPAVFDLNNFSNTLNGLNGNGTIDITGGGTSTLNFGFNDDNGLFSGVIQNTSGTLGIVKLGLGTEILVTSNTYLGPTILNGGTLRVSNTFALGAGNSPVIVNLGNLDMDTNLIVTNLNGAGGGIINSSTATNLLTVQNGGAYSGVISGKISLQIVAGTLRLNGANTYSNGTFVASGAGLAIGAGAANPGPGLVYASNNVTISMPAAVSASSAFSPPITNVNGATVTYTSGETANTWANQFNGNASATDIFTGGNMSISGALSFSNFLGTVIVTNGEVRWFNALSGGDNTTFVFQGPTGGSFARDAADIIHLGALFGNGVITQPSVSFPATYWIGGKGNDSDFSGQITGSNNIVKVGAGKLTLDGFTASVLATDNSTFTNFQYGSALTNVGFTTVSNGTLVLTAPNDLTASQAITVANPTAVLDATSMGYVTNFIDGTNQNSAIVTNGILTIVATTEVSGLPQVLGGNGAVKGNGVINNGTINPGFAIPLGNFQAGTLTLSNQLTVNAGATNFFDLSDDPTGLIAPSDLLNVGGNVVLSGNSTIGIGTTTGFMNPGKYTIIKYGGTLNNESGVVPPGSVPNWTVVDPNTRATLIVSNSTSEVDLYVASLNTSNLVWVGGQNNNVWDINNTINWNSTGPVPAVFFQQDFVTFDNSSANTNLILSNNVAPTTITVTGANNYFFGGSGNIIGDTSLTLNGPGFLAFTNTTGNTYRGGTVINGGILKAGNESGGNQNDLDLGTSNVLINAGAELRFGGNSGAAVNHFVTNNIIVSNGIVTAWDGVQHLTNSTVTIGASGGTFHTVFSGKNLVLDSPLAGPGNLTIASATSSNAAQVILNNTNNTISGTVAIATNANLAMTGFAGLSNAPTIDVQQGGVLDITGKSSSTWAVVSGQTVKGNGIIRGKNIAVNSGGTIAPGVAGAIGTLVVTNVNSTNFTILTLSGITSMDINRGSNPNADLILNGRGTNNFGGTLNVNNLGAAPQLGDSFTLFNSSVNNGSFTTVNLPALSSGLAWSNSLAANGKITVVSSGPTPPTVSAVITNFSLSLGTNIILAGTNAQSGATYYLITSTNVGLPLTNWRTIGTNVGVGNGFSFTGTNAVNSTLGKQFYLLSSTNFNP
jgi:autotransporter-associated beta strand protein